MEDNKTIPKVNIEDILTTACKLPYCKIDRDIFLKKQLTGKISPTQLTDAL